MSIAETFVVQWSYWIRPKDIIVAKDIADSDHLDARLDAADEDALRSFAAAGGLEGECSMFDNRFFNQFVNSPNFTKRLRRPERPGEV